MHLVHSLFIAHVEFDRCPQEALEYDVHEQCETMSDVNSATENHQA